MQRVGRHSIHFGAIADQHGELDLARQKFRQRLGPELELALDGFVLFQEKQGGQAGDHGPDNGYVVEQRTCLQAS
jgi:hypothetical protein